MNANTFYKNLMFTFVFLCCCFLVQFPCNALEKNGYVSISQLKEEIKNGWHESYTAHGRTVAVDVDVLVPQVDAFPILRVKKTAAVPKELLQGYDFYDHEMNFTTVCKMPDTYAAPKVDSWFKESFVLQPEQIHWNQCLSEGNTLTTQGALDIFRKEFSTFFGNERYQELMLQELLVRGRQYEYNRKTKTFGKPLDAFGSYEFTFSQGLYDIPIIIDGKRSFSPQIKGEVAPPRTHVSANIFADDFFSISVELVDMIDIVQTDVPLLRFENAKKGYEELIHAGLLREVLSIRLGYMLSSDPMEKDVFLATPVWVLTGEMYDNAGQETVPLNDETKYYRPIRNVILEGQQGYLVDNNSTLETRRNAPTVLTWEQIR